jgi:hypothetical protein
VADYSRYSDSTLRQLHAECKEQYSSLHAKKLRLEHQGQQKTPEYRRVIEEARRQHNVMTDIEREGDRRGLILRH